LILAAYPHSDDPRRGELLEHPQAGQKLVLNNFRQFVELRLKVGVEQYNPGHVDLLILSKRPITRF
jgi:hypothetical protein